MSKKYEIKSCTRETLSKTPIIGVNLDNILSDFNDYIAELKQVEGVDLLVPELENVLDAKFVGTILGMRFVLDPNSNFNKHYKVLNEKSIHEEGSEGQA